ncbi:MAG: GumC family protein, partial [Opitutales bacterium]
MDTTPKQEKSTGAGSYPYTYYGTNYNGYSAVGYGETAVQRGFQDYVLILRERIWYIVVVFLLVFSSALVFTFSQTKTYLSIASVQIFRRDAIVMQVQSVVDNDIRSAEDLNTQVKVLESLSIVQHVADRLTGEDLRNFLAPYRKEGASEPPVPAEIIFKNRKIIPIRLSLIIQVQYIHPDKNVAARVANLFLDEYISYNARLRIEDAMKAVDDLKVRADQQKKKVEEMAFTLQSYREKNNLVSLDQRKDIVTEKLKALNLYVTQTNAHLKEAEIRWRQVQEHRLLGTAQLAELPFIASQPIIGQLQQQVATQKIALAQLREHYRDRHPKMIEAVNSLNQTERELNKALEEAATSVESDYQNSQRNDAGARASLAQQETESLELDRAAVD